MMDYQVVIRNGIKKKKKTAWEIDRGAAGAGYRSLQNVFKYT